MGSSNIGKTGLDSIRLGGMSLDMLPIRESAITQEQWSEVEANDKRQQIENILAEYPKGKISYFNSRIDECQENIERIRQLKADQQKMINEYTAHIGLCKHRDKMLALTDDPAEIRKLNIQFPPYNVEAMEEQIKLCEDAIERSDNVIDQEFSSILELRDVINRCQERDAKLKPFGVKVG